MRCGQPWLALVLLSGCFEHLDTCDEPKAAEVQVNALTSGDQTTTPTMAVARIASGGFVATWVSRTGGGGDTRSEVRATLLSKEGKPVPPCGSTSGDVAVSVANDAEVQLPVVAAGLTQDAPIFIAWMQRDPDAAQETVHLRLLTQDLCSWARSGPQTITASEPGEDNTAPALAVRTDGQQALLTWLAFTPGVVTTKLRMRPVGLSTDSSRWLLENGCNLMPVSCIVNEDGPLGPPAVTSTANGYALAWPGPRDDGAAGWQVRLTPVDKNGTPGLTPDTGSRQFGVAQRLYLALSANAVELAVVAAIENGPNVNDVDRGVFIERFTPMRIFPTDPETELLIPVGSQVQGVMRVDPQSGGTPHRPAVHLFDNSQAVIAWTSELAGGVNELRGTLVDAKNATMFNGLACNVGDFAWPVARASNDGMTSSLAGEGTSAMAVFHSATPVRGGTDSLGTSVHALRLDFHALSPLLR